MLDEHGRIERRRHVPDVTSSNTSAPGADAVGDAVRRYADPRFWRAIGRRRRLIALGIACGIVALAAMIALAWAISSLSQGAEEPAARPERTRIPETTPPGQRAATSSATTAGSSADGTGTADDGGKPSPAGRAALVAYRRDGAICVAEETGAGERRVVASPSGPFALSGDGSKLAVADGASSRLWIVDVATGSRRDIGPAAAVRPDWSPDSQWLLYSRPVGDEQEIVRIAAAGHGATALMRGVNGRFDGSADLAVAAPRSATLPSQVVAVCSDGRSVRIGKRISAVEVCPGPKGLYVADAGSGTTPPSILYVSGDPGPEMTVVPAPAAGNSVRLSGLSVSPDGKWLVWAETRDDGYSRMYARQSTGLKVIPLRAHRDSYLIGWSADGSELLRIEGNAAQGEATKLTASHPDGTGWRVVVEGAGI